MQVGFGRGGTTKKRFFADARKAEKGIEGREGIVSQVIPAGFGAAKNEEKKWREGEEDLSEWHPHLKIGKMIS